jgi:LEA14-like dessication related protein
MNMRSAEIRVFSLLAVFLAFVGACTSVPEAEEKSPGSYLRFDHAEAAGLGEISLFYHISAENPRAAPARLAVAGWTLSLDGLDMRQEGVPALFVDGMPAGDASVAVPANGRLDIPLRLDISTEQFRDTGSGPHRAELGLETAWRYGGDEPIPLAIHAAAEFPRIREPEFTITSIAIMQAELINTRFRVNLRIDNPNLFPLDLSSFGYELYGDGLFWADGEEHDVLHIPAGASSEAKLFLVMNFIDMKRNLLDDVIKMRMVRYRFKGEVMVATDIAYLPRFNMAFDKSGLSEVLK